ncbi:MAG: aldehyde dehydrogenase family protein [Fimbriimonadaceae bacterium]|nr:aldehyde dehydrogenase family protein [Fimbriimonadaceae bacterium]
MVHRELLINGVLIGGPCDQGVGKEIAVNPWDGSRVGSYAEGGWGEMSAALDAAHTAFPLWRATPMEERVALCLRIADEIESRRGELATLLVQEVGKPITAAEGEVDRMAVTFRLAPQIAKALGSFDVDPGLDKRAIDYTVQAVRRPIGPVLGIVPWNWPFNLAAHKIVPSLVAGCPVILRPSSQSALSTLSLARLIHEVGIPDGVLQAIATPTAISEKAVTDPRSSVVSFTGSAAVGWHLRELIPDRPMALELGGDASVILFADADLDAALPKIVAGAFAYAGQICISVQHLRVEAAIYDSVRERLIPLVEAVKAGDPSERDTVVGPLIDEKARERVRDWITSAEAAGARVLAGGIGGGVLIPATLIEDVPAKHPLNCDEVFGPVLVLHRFISESDAVEQVNASEYGLQCGIFDSDLDRARRLSALLDVGGVVINDVPTVRFDAMPYGGRKASGQGREGGVFALEHLTEWQAVVTRQC